MPPRLATNSDYRDQPQKYERANCALELETLAVDESLGEREFRATIITYGTRVDTWPFPTVFEPGAFAAAITRLRGAAAPMPFLWQHDPGEPLGHFVDISEGPEGLRVRGTVSRYPLGDRALAQMRDGTLRRFSIGFSVLQAEHREDPTIGDMVRYVTEADVAEASLVTFAADRNALLEDVASSGHGVQLENYLTQHVDVLSAFGRVASDGLEFSDRARELLSKSAEALNALYAVSRKSGATDEKPEPEWLNRLRADYASVADELASWED